MKTLILVIGFPTEELHNAALFVGDMFDASIISGQETREDENLIVAQAQSILLNGGSVLIERPNISRTTRRHILRRLKNACDYIVGIKVNLTAAEALERNPQEKEQIIELSSSFETPGYDEGFDDIIITNKEGEIFNE